MNMRNCFVALFVFFSFSIFGNKIPVDTSGTPIDDFNEIKKAIALWNDAINHRSLEELKSIYADEVQYYLVKRSATDCIKSKISWLNKRPKFTQKIKNISVYTIGNKNEKPDIIAEFKKECFDGVSTNEYDGLVVFRKIDNEWRLIKETDITTEVKRYYNSTPMNLPDGSYSYVREYFKYSYDKKTDSTRLLRYTYDLDLKIEVVGPVTYQTPTYSFTGKLSIHSGAINSVNEYKIRSGSRKNGILEIVTALDDSEGNMLGSTKQILRFKVVSKDELVLLNADMPWLYGKPMNVKK
jgi:hypothetical protein